MTTETQLVQFDSLKAEITMFVAPTKDIVITDLQSASVAQDVLKQIKGFQKQIETKRVELVAPHNDFVKRINAYAKGIEAPLVEAEQSVRGKLLAHAREDERRREEERRKIEAQRQAELKKAQEERQKAEAEARAKAQAMAAFGCSTQDAQKAELESKARIEREQAEKQRVLDLQAKSVAESRLKNTAKVWTYEVEDLSKIPAEYLILDSTKVRNAIRAGARTIPGLRIFEETQIRAI